MSDAVRLRTPLTTAATRLLRAGQEVIVSGTVITARDAAHRYLVERRGGEPLPFDLKGAVLYHCGPIMMKDADGQWQAVSAGPTTSARMETYEAKVIERYGVAAIIGKGGMGGETAAALKRTGAVYLTAAAGAGALLAKRIVRVEGVWKLDEFGEPEAMWRLIVEDFPAIVAMDSAGGNIYAAVEANSKAALGKLMK